LLFAQDSYKVTNTQGSSSKTTDAFSPSPLIDASLGKYFSSRFRKDD
jgi:hypothetical protein